MRQMTADERAVLAHVVLDPDAWWEHVNVAANVDAETALAQKVARWRPAYLAAVAAGNYKNRAQREAE